MIKSMTGFGKAETQFQNKNYILELRSLNSKGLELNTRLPIQFREIEIHLKKIIGESLQRGKIDLSLNIEYIEQSSSKNINLSVVNQYIEQLREIEDADRLDLLKIAMRLPDTLKTELNDNEEDEIKTIESLLEKALINLNKYRVDEGSSLEEDFKKRLIKLKALIDKVIQIDPERKEKIENKLRTSIEELQIEIDENRFEQELIYYIEKYDITEERVRLDSHIEYFTHTMENSSSNGKKLGFIAQEMGREINTIGSKASHAGLQKVVIQMKDELEKIKEQLLNVL
ncbi:MAG: YicC/YloC family endoribonuclease [Bacteroidota bacterium]|nr:YicC/YloC family endoribonuclease [Bacteroidota bacterium]|tara:strand:- start:1335 stop:2192 length:858 start_codon:yes stop_codon:yes gene_type:complete